MNETFRALSDPTRRKILNLLSKGDMNAGEIADCFTISKPSISHHLNILSEAELVLREKRGQHVIYSINTTVLDDVIKWFFDMKGEKDEVEKK